MLRRKINFYSGFQWLSVFPCFGGRLQIIVVMDWRFRRLKCMQLVQMHHCHYFHHVKCNLMELTTRSIGAFCCYCFQPPWDLCPLCTVSAQRVALFVCLVLGTVQFNTDRQSYVPQCMIVYHDVCFTQDHLVQQLAVETSTLESCLPHCGLFLMVQIVLEHFSFCFCLVFHLCFVVNNNYCQQYLVVLYFLIIYIHFSPLTLQV